MIILFVLTHIDNSFMILSEGYELAVRQPRVEDKRIVFEDILF